MTWKQLCVSFKHKRTVKRHHGWKAVLQRCGMFDMRGVADGLVHDDYLDRMETGGSVNLPPLPFPEVAIVNDWRTIVMSSFVTDEEQSFIGGDLLALGVPFNEHRRDYWEIVSGNVMVDLSGDEAVHDCTEVCRTYVLAEEPLDYEDLVRRDIHAENKSSDDDVLHDMFFDAIKFLIYIDAPTRFMVAETPKKLPKPKNDEIARLTQRRRYIVLDKQAIVKRYLESQPSGRRSPMPHLRRGHYRTLVSDRYRTTKGQRVWVRATHVAGNTVEWREGDRFYKVI
jgi:hypothetical protein